MTTVQQQLEALGLVKKSSSDKKNYVKFPVPGTEYKGEIIGEPYVEPQVDINGTWDPLYMEVQGEENGKRKWKKVPERDLTEDSERFALTQTNVPVRSLEDGSEGVLSFVNQEEKDALALAVQDAGVLIAPGNAIRKKFIKKDGSRKVWSVTLVAPQEG